MTEYSKLWLAGVSQGGSCSGITGVFSKVKVFSYPWKMSWVWQSVRGEALEGEDMGLVRGLLQSTPVNGVGLWAGLGQP